MDFITLLLFAVGLSFDTFAVSITTGFISNHIRFWQATKMALVLAFFQGLMPLLGWLTGLTFRDLISDYDHWITFGLLTAIGAKMIHESQKHEDDRKDFNPFNPFILIGIAIATSIDAFVVGVSFALVEINIVLAVAIIFFITYVVAMLGMLIGKKTGGTFGKKMEVIGGIMLVGLGVQTLVQHLIST